MAVVEGTRRRDVGATTQDLYSRYGRQIYAYCYHRLRSREEAEDAVQTTFMNAFRALQRGAETQFEQAWLFKIAQNVCIARSSSSARRLRLEVPNDFEVLQEIVPSQEGERPVELIGVEEALEGMPANQRRAILLREWQGLSYREIGEELGLSQSAVEMLIFRARRALAGALEQPDVKKGRKLSSKLGSAGSLLGALKTLLGGGTVVKAAAVAAAGAIAVVGESAQHTIVRHVSSAPRIPTAVTAKTLAAHLRVETSSHAQSVTSAPRAEPSRAAVTAGAVHTHAATLLRASHVSAHPSSSPRVRPDGEGEAATVPATTTAAPAPTASAPPPAVTTVAAAPAPSPVVSQPPAPQETTTTPAQPEHGKKAADPAPVDRRVAQTPPVKFSPMPVMPIASAQAPPATTTVTTTTTTTAVTTPTPAPAAPPWQSRDHAHDGGRHGHDHAPPADPADTTVTVTTTTTTTTTVATPAPLAPSAPVASGGPAGPADVGRHQDHGWQNGR